jgi:hypothetical protein
VSPAELVAIIAGILGASVSLGGIGGMLIVIGRRQQELLELGRRHAELAAESRAKLSSHDTRIGHISEGMATLRGQVESILDRIPN